MSELIDVVSARTATVVKVWIMVVAMRHLLAWSLLAQKSQWDMLDRLDDNMDNVHATTYVVPGKALSCTVVFDDYDLPIELQIYGTREPTKVVRNDTARKRVVMVFDAKSKLWKETSSSPTAIFR